MKAALLLSASLFFREPARALARNKLRSSLTTIGIMIGIAAVVAVVAIGRAGSLRSEEQLQNVGNNLVWVEAGGRAPNGVRTGNHGTNTLTLGDADALRKVPLIKSVSPQIDGAVQLTLGNKNWRSKFRGISPDYLDIRRWTVAEGAAFTDEDVKRAANVVLIGNTVKDKLFGESDPLGQVLRIDAQLLQVIGVLAPKGQSAGGQDQDDFIMLPYTTAQRKFRTRSVTWVDDIMCSAVSATAVAPAVEEITLLMRERHHIRPGADDDFNIRQPEEVIKAQIETQNTFATLLISIAFVSLVVGGIGIMNVMLVSVAERTREIGLRLAVGATELAVQLQFLGEAVTLSLLGGVLGIVLGVISSLLIGHFLEWPMVIPPQALILAPIFAAAVGVFFGFYPARKAARLDPIEALRHE